MTCCICKKEFHGWGNNPYGAIRTKQDGTVEMLENFSATDMCCGECNTTYVIPGRIYRMKLQEALAKKAKDNTDDK